MEKPQFVLLIDNLLRPYGFKRNGAHWNLDNGLIIKKIIIQKSAFGNRYYINYGYILKNLPLNRLKMHIYLGLGSVDLNENGQIIELLDFDSHVPDDVRVAGLADKISKYIVEKMKLINNESDLAAEVERGLGANAIPVVVKDYFKDLNGDRKPRPR